MINKKIQQEILNLDMILDIQEIAEEMQIPKEDLMKFALFLYLVSKKIK